MENLNDKITAIDMEIRNKMSEMQHYKNEIARMNTEIAKIAAEINKLYGKIEAFRELQGDNNSG